MDDNVSSNKQNQDNIMTININNAYKNNNKSDAEQSRRKRKWVTGLVLIFCQL